jgi:hypothetical protein
MGNARGEAEWARGKGSGKLRVVHGAGRRFPDLRLSSSSVLSDRTSALDVSSAPPAVSCHDGHAHRSARDRTSPSAQFACSRSNTHLSIDEFTTACRGFLVATALDIHHLYIYTHESIGIQSREDLVCFGLVQVLCVGLRRRKSSRDKMGCWRRRSARRTRSWTGTLPYCWVCGPIGMSARGAWLNSPASGTCKSHPLVGVSLFG